MTEPRDTGTPDMEAPLRGAKEEKMDTQTETLDSLAGAAQAEFCLRVKTERKLAIATDILRAHGLDEEYEELVDG